MINFFELQKRLIFFLTIIRIKQILLTILSGVLLVNLYTFVSIMQSKPEIESLQLIINNNNDINKSTSTLTMENNIEDKSNDFNYQLVGFRVASNGNSSIIVKKNNKEFVVQVGELLENQYKLDSVNKDKAVFSYAGSIYEIENSFSK